MGADLPRRKPSPRSGLSGPFGAVEQRETASLRALGLESSRLAQAKVIIQTLRERLNRGTDWCHDSNASLSKWSGLSSRTLNRALGAERGWLVGLGVIELGPASTVIGGTGRGGLRTYQPRRARAFNEWPRPDGAIKAGGFPPQADREGLRHSEAWTAPTEGIGSATSAHIPKARPNLLPDDVDRYAMDAVDALSEAGFAGVADAQWFGALHRRRPMVDLIGEIEQWVAWQAKRGKVHDAKRALRGWLERARDCERSPRPPYCTEPGCRGRGHGPALKCVQHHPASRRGAA